MNKEKKYKFENGFMIHTVQFIGQVDRKKHYHINIIDEQNEFNKEYPEMPFWETVEEFDFDNAKEANEQFIRSYDYYKNYTR